MLFLSDVMDSPPASKPTMGEDQMSDAQPEVFPFFRLPRELRDNIYAAVPLECKSSADGQIPGAKRCKFNVIAKILKVNLLLVSKQFRQEYTKDTQKCTSLSIHENYYIGNDRDWRLPTFLKNISNVEISLTLAVYYGFPDLAGRKAWVAKVLNQLPKMAALRIRGGVVRKEWTTRGYETKQLGLAFNQEFWQSLPRLVDIKIYRVLEHWEVDYNDPKLCKDLLFEFPSQDEKVVRVEQQQ